jgi:hypothetical protein
MAKTIKTHKRIPGNLETLHQKRDELSDQVLEKLDQLLSDINSSEKFNKYIPTEGTDKGMIKPYIGKKRGRKPKNISQEDNPL